MQTPCIIGLSTDSFRSMRRRYHWSTTHLNDVAKFYALPLVKGKKSLWIGLTSLSLKLAPQLFVFHAVSGGGSTYISLLQNEWCYWDIVIFRREISLSEMSFLLHVFKSRTQYTLLNNQTGLCMWISCCMHAMSNAMHHVNFSNYYIGHNNCRMVASKKLKIMHW